MEGTSVSWWQIYQRNRYSLPALPVWLPLINCHLYLNADSTSLKNSITLHMFCHEVIAAEAVAAQVVWWLNDGNRCLAIDLVSHNSL